MKTTRWLLPFTHGVDMRAIDHAVQLADSGGATLVAVSLISVPDKPRPGGARLEHIQQSKDFLEAVKWKAARYKVQVERYEIFTADVIQSITMLTHELEAAGIVLVSSGEKALLLQAREMQHLLTEPPTSLVLIRLSAQTNSSPLRQLGARLLRWLHGLLGLREGARLVSGRASSGGTILDQDGRALPGMTGSRRKKETTCMAGARILLVEDDEVLRDLVRRNLQAREHDVCLAADAESALAHLRAAPFDLIVLDINLPDQTGWEVLRTARREGWLHPQEIDGDIQKLPVVVLSAVRVSPRRLMEFHPLAYLPKPFPMEALLRLAAEAARRRNGNAAYGTGETAGSENPQSNEEELYA